MYVISVRVGPDCPLKASKLTENNRLNRGTWELEMLVADTVGLDRRTALLFFEFPGSVIRKIIPCVIGDPANSLTILVLPRIRDWSEKGRRNYVENRDNLDGLQIGSS